jgi:DNA-binding PadR family transcriptional regulator
MSAKHERDLTLLEYVVLGLISIEPKTGYTIISYFEDGAYSWSASPGSVYPLLKRLESQNIIAGQLEMEHETRPRKVYSLTPLGEQLLDEWLIIPPNAAPILEERDKAAWKFLFMGRRFSTPQVIKWLDAYEEKLMLSSAIRGQFRDLTRVAMEDAGISELRASVHQQLLLEQNIMEINMQRMWIQMARERLQQLGRQTGEFEAVNDSPK